MMAEVGNGAEMKPTSKIGVLVQNAFKSYTASQTVLKGINMTVPQGVIYGLLGPSGCGKTTLLNCIIGRTRLDAGRIELDIRKLEQLGYMPQSLCLHGRLNIIENFYFHGYLFGMTDSDIAERAEKLMSFLKLPSEYTLISELSGGQQRRVSLATAFFHKPKLLILDEPTVGLDPILSLSIWELLKEMAKLGVTIVITTHYMQEALRADVIGFMREGVIVAEKNPQELLLKFGCETLDDVFLQLSQEQERGKSLCLQQNVETMKKKSVLKKPFKVIFENRTHFSLAKFRGLSYKTMSLLKRDYLVMLVVLILPLVNTYLFNAAIGRNPKGLYLAVVNDEVPLLDCPVTNNTCFLEEDETHTFSCLFIDIMKSKSYKFIQYESESIALAEVRKNKAWALLHFTKNFSASLSHRLQDGPSVDPEYIVNSSIDTWIDASNRYIGSFIMYDIVRAMTAFLEQIFRDCGANPKIGSLPIVFEKPIYGEYDVNFITYSAGAMICIYCFILPSVWSCMQMFIERMDGILERTQVTGTTIFDISVSVFIFQIVVHVLQTAMSVFVMYVWFDNPFYGSTMAFGALMMLTGSAGIFFGIMLGLISDNLIMVGGTSSGTVIMLCLTTGLVWPIEGMHHLLKLVRWFFPLTWVVDATRGICIKSYPFVHPVVFKGFISVLVLNAMLAASIYVLPKLKAFIMKKIN